MYKILQKYNEVQSNIKEKWEKDLKINITEEWRRTLGGEQELKYIHMLFTCPVLKTYWEGVREILKYIFELKEPLQVQHWLGVYLKGKIRAKDIYFFNILRVTASKQVTKAWKQPNTPNLRTWLLTTEQSLEMERLTFVNREQLLIWKKLYCKERLIKTVETFHQIKEI